MADAPYHYWLVRLEVFAFDTEAEAREYQDKLEDAFCDMPESAGYGSASRYYRDDADPESVLKAKLDAAKAALRECIEHCQNSGRGNVLVNDRIYERVEETARAALAKLEGK